jgi:hypothetical protein
MNGQSKPETNDASSWKHWFRTPSSSERRRARRQPLPGLVAYYWDGGAPEPRGIQEISSTGMYLLTDQSWYKGTLMTMTLQRTDSTDDGLERSIAVQTRVVRSGTDGVGLAFVFSEVQNVQTNATDRKGLNKFLHRFLNDHQEPWWKFWKSSKWK